MLNKFTATWVALFSFSSSLVYASPYSVNLSVPLIISQDPANLHGYRASLLYQPPSWTWEHWQLFLDGGFGHWWVSDTNTYKSLNIYSIAPVFRYYFKNYTMISPFFDISIGLSYLTKSRLDDHNLGIHFAFQDQLGLGVSFGAQQRLSVSITALHYSNASMSAMNAGISVPVMLNVSYRV